MNPDPQPLPPTVESLEVSAIFSEDLHLRDRVDHRFEPGLGT